MDKYNVEIERVEGGEKITHFMLGEDNGAMFLTYCARFVARIITVFDVNKGDITEIKANRGKDGTVFVSVLGAQDRIFAKIWRCRNG
jgi:hypothetical protein